MVTLGKTVITLALTDLEFDVLDELYFVTSFQQLQEALGIKENKLKLVLQTLLNKEWVKCYLDHSEELLANEVDLENNYKTYSYLATKAGLLAHNGR